MHFQLNLEITVKCLVRDQFLNQCFHILDYSKWLNICCQNRNINKQTAYAYITSIYITASFQCWTVNIMEILMNSFQSATSFQNIEDTQGFVFVRAQICVPDSHHIWFGLQSAALAPVSLREKENIKNTSEVFSLTADVWIQASAATQRQFVPPSPH